MPPFHGPSSYGGAKKKNTQQKNVMNITMSGMEIGVCETNNVVTKAIKNSEIMKNGKNEEEEEKKTHAEKHTHY